MKSEEEIRMRKHEYESQLEYMESLHSWSTRVDRDIQKTKLKIHILKWVLDEIKAET
jgi:hypothetical protein